MDRRVPEAVSYWTGVWDPNREAISKEVAALRAALNPTATVVSISAGQRSRLHRAERVVQLSGNRWVALRVLAGVLERRAKITHVFGEMHAWHLLRAVGRRPIVFTVTIPGQPLPQPLLDKVAIFAAESQPLADALIDAGVEEDRIRIVYPGIDLARFSPGGVQRDRFTVVFASAPSSVEQFEDRGIPLLVEVARRCPEIDIQILWRRWGDITALQQEFARLKPPSNVIGEWRDVDDMATVYRAAHAAIFLPAAGHGKSCPNSIIEALACGCPAVVSQACGITGLLTSANAGIEVSREPGEVVRAIRTLSAEHRQRSEAALILANGHFAFGSFLNAYRDIYDDVAGRHA